MNSHLTRYLVRILPLALIAIVMGCSPAPPSETETIDLARSILKKYLYSVIKLSASAQAENEQMQNNAQRMFDALDPNPSASSTPTKSQGQIETELVAQHTAEADKILSRSTIRPGKSGTPAKADLIATGNQTFYWPVSFEAIDPEHPDTLLTVTILAYRGSMGKWEDKARLLVNPRARFLDSRSIAPGRRTCPAEALAKEEATPLRPWTSQHYASFPN
jgi:hypothetical protein